MDGFKFKTGDVVLAEWTDKLFYAKILQINHSQLSCSLLFDDYSIEDCPISKIHSVTETTADIVCIICKDGTSSRPNEIVLCDKCGVGYHQRCHQPFIKDNALEPEAPWMCIYCSNGTECPYLLNPFESKLKDLTSNSRKHRGLTKDNHYSSERSDFRQTHRGDRVRPHMGDHYDDAYPRLGTETSRSRARHVLGEHRVMNRRTMMDHRISDHHGSEYYPFPEGYDGSTAGRYHYRHMESLSKRRRISQQPKQKATQDVWDNVYTSYDSNKSTDGTDTSKTKVTGKDGPREKQRLTQDLERQRKKLKEDMQRGQELQREHNQLLTRDRPRTKTDDGTADDEINELATEEHERRDTGLYSRGCEWTRGFRAEKSPSNLAENSSKANDEPQVEHRETGLGENVCSNNDELALRQQLDSCGCDVKQGEGEINSYKQENGKHYNNEDVRERLVVKMADMQCEHSSSCQPDSGECHSNRSDIKCNNTSTERNENRLNHSGNMKEESTYDALEVVDSSDNVNENLYTSEKVEVIGQSEDVSNSKYSGEVHKERQGKGRQKKTISSHGKGSGRGHKKCHRSSCGGKTNQENVFDEGKIRKMKEGSNGWSPLGKPDKESLDETTGADVTSLPDTEVVDTEDRRGTERTKGKSCLTTHESGDRKDRDIDVQNVIAQNRVRSDLPRHNWLIERLRNEKKLPCDTSESSGEETKEKKAYSEGPLRNLKEDVTSSTRHDDIELVKAPAHSTTSPVSDDNDTEDRARNQVISCTEKQAKSYKEANETTDENVDSVNQGSPALKVLTPSTSPANHSPELARLSPTVVTASPCEENDELKNSPSPLLKINEISETVFGAKRSNHSSEDSSDEETSEDCKRSSSDDNPAVASETVKFIEGKSNQDCEENNLSIVDDGLNDKSTNPQDEKIIEIQSDGEGSDDVKQSNDQNNKEREMSKISTGKSVNPVSPIVRRQRRSVDEMKAANHEIRRHDAVPRSPRIPSELPLPFVNPGYFAGYSPRTFTPHLITHSAPSVPGLSAPVSPISRHAGLSSIPSHHLGASRLEVSGQTKPNLSCPFHGKKGATEKMIHHTPGYPMMHGDHHLLNRIPFHEGLPDVAAFKMREKFRDQLEFAGDPLGMHRRLSTIYDRHMMPHGMHGPVHHPRYLGPGIIDDPGYIERELLKRRFETAYPSHESSKHMYPSEEHRNAPKYNTSPSEEKREASKHVRSPTGEHRHGTKYPSLSEMGAEPTKTRRPAADKSVEHHVKHHRDMLVAARRLSPHEEKYLKGDQTAIFDVKSPMKQGKHSPSPVRIASHTPPSGALTKEHRSAFIQLGETKKIEGEAEVDSTSHHPKRSPGGTLDQESISRDFDERFSMLDRTFKKKMEAAESSERQHNRESIIFLDDNVPNAYRKFAHRETPLYATGHPRDGTVRPVGEPMSSLPRGHEISNYKNPDTAGSPATRNSPPGPPPRSRGESRSEELESQRRIVNPSSHKLMPFPSYRTQEEIISTIPSSPRDREFQNREGLAKSFMKAPSHPGPNEFLSRYDNIPSSLRMAGYAPTRNPDENPAFQERIAREKTEFVSSQREQQEKEIDLARQKHQINLAHFEQERRKAIMNNDRSARLPSRTDERKERTHPRGIEMDQWSPRMRDEMVRRDWEQAEARKRKYEEMNAQVTTPNGRLSPFQKIPGDERLKAISKDDHISKHSPMHKHVPGDFDPRKEHYLSMYGKPRIDPYRQHVTTVPYPGRGGNAGNAPFYMSQFDLHRMRHEPSGEEALRKQREFTEDQPTVQKFGEPNTTEPAKKRAKSVRMCNVCGKEASFLCSGCHKAWYCSPKCQLKAWAEHSKECTETKRR